MLFTTPPPPRLCGREANCHLFVESTGRAPLSPFRPRPSAPYWPPTCTAEHCTSNRYGRMMCIPFSRRGPPSPRARLAPGLVALPTKTPSWLTERTRQETSDDPLPFCWSSLCPCPALGTPRLLRGGRLRQASPFLSSAPGQMRDGELMRRPSLVRATLLALCPALGTHVGKQSPVERRLMMTALQVPPRYANPAIQPCLVVSPVCPAWPTSF